MLLTPDEIDKALDDYVDLQLAKGGVFIPTDHLKPIRMAIAKAQAKKLAEATLRWLEDDGIPTTAEKRLREKFKSEGVL